MRKCFTANFKFLTQTHYSRKKIPSFLFTVTGSCSGGAMEQPELLPTLLEPEQEQVSILVGAKAKQYCSQLVPLSIILLSIFEEFCTRATRPIIFATCALKVRPHGQQFSHTTLYKKVVRHKTCRGHAKSCCVTNVRTSTILQRKKWQKYVQITSHSTQHVCETIMLHEFLLKWTDIWRFTILVAQHKMSHNTRRPYRPHYHDTFYVAQPCCTKLYN